MNVVIVMKLYMEEMLLHDIKKQSILKCIVRCGIKAKLKKMIYELLKLHLYINNIFKKERFIFGVKENIFLYLRNSKFLNQ